jgi:hypothetical protein
VPAALCPKCRVPLSREESRSGKCPFCAAPLGASEAAAHRRAELPPPVDERAASLPLPESVKPLLRGAIILLALGVGGGGLYYAVSAGVTRYLGGPEPWPDAALQEPETPPGDPPDATAPDEVAPPAASLAARAPSEEEPSRLPQSEKPAAAPPAAEAKSGARPVLPQEVVLARGVLKIDSPEGEYFVEPIDGAVHVLLRGRVKTLRIGSLGGDALLDASALKAEAIVFAGAVSGRARAQVYTAGGSVEFRGPVNGRANLIVNAPNGKVTFAGPAGGRPGAGFGGESNATIKARELDVQCPISGDAQMYVVLSGGGKLRFTEMEGRSLLFFHKANARDPDSVIERGITRDDSRCRETR